MTDKYLNLARELREDPNVHYSCSQATFLPFAQEKGVDRETALAISSNFNSGMKSGMTCGAVTGGLMVLGLYGVNDNASVVGYLRKIRNNHAGTLECRDLLAANAKTGMPQHQHCDGMVYESVEALTQLLEERGLID